MIDVAQATEKLEKTKKELEDIEKKIFSFMSNARGSNPIEEMIRKTQKEIGMDTHSFYSLKERVKKLEDEMKEIHRAFRGH